jgi:hypothetical protein
MNEVDWDNISCILSGIELVIQDLNLLSEADLEHELYSWLTYGLIPSDINSNSDICFSLSPLKQTLGQIANMAMLAYGVARTPGAADALPTWLTKSMKGVRHDVDVAKNAIRTKTLSTEFLLAWARINQLYGLMEFMESGAFSVELSNRVDRNRITDLTIKKHWYAHWIRENAPLFARDQIRDVARQLAQVCLDIRDGELVPWGPYPRDWYACMLSESNKCALTKRLEKIGRDDLKLLSSHALVKRDALPPLNRRGFVVKR